MRRGMTLIELILVVALIILLAALFIYPASRSVREGVWRTQCVSSLRQIGKAILMYREDYDGAGATEGTAMEYYELGLPPTSVSLHPKYLIAGSGVWRCPLEPPNPPDFETATSYTRLYLKPGKRIFGDRGPTWAEVVKEQGENVFVYMDDRHNPPLHGTHIPRTLILLRLNGQVEVKRGTYNDIYLKW